MTPAEATAVSGATRPRLRDCPASVRELRARERALCGLHQLDRTLHAFWERLPLRELRIVGTVAVLGIGVYLVVVRRGSIEHSLSRVGSAQPGWVAVAVAAELVSLVCYAALVRVLLQLGTVTVPFRALFSLTVIGIAMINSVPGGQAISTIYWYEQLRRYAVQRSVAAFALLVSSLLGIVTLVLLAACGLAAGSHGFGAQARFPVLAVAAAILIAAILGRRQFVPAALWAVRHLGGRDVPARAAARRQSSRAVACARLSELAVRRRSSLRSPRGNGPDDPSPWSGRCLHAWPTRLRDPDSSGRRRHDRSDHERWAHTRGRHKRRSDRRGAPLPDRQRLGPCPARLGTMARHAQRPSCPARTSCRSGLTLLQAPRLGCVS
jgi:hypothetical protein